MAIEKRLTIGLKSQTGWSLSHMANVCARLADGEKAKEALDILSRCCLGQNFFTYHNDWRKMGPTLDLTWGRTAPFQMDANFGIAAAVTEMLCGSSVNMIRILPALPSAWKTGEFRDMLTRAGVRTSVQWNIDKNEIKISLVAERNTIFDLKFPYEPKELECNQLSILKESKYGKNYRALSLEKGQIVNITIWISGGEYRLSETLVFGLEDSAKAGIRESSKSVRWHETGDFTGRESWEERERFIHGRQNIIENNDIYDVMDIMQDGNGVYISGAGHGNIVACPPNRVIRGMLSFEPTNDMINAGSRVFHNIFYATQSKQPFLYYGWN